MMRVLAALSWLAVSCPILAAEDPKPGEPIKLTLTPAPAPVPALKYHLLPEVKDLTPGNAVQLYYRAFSPEWMSWYYRDNMWEKVDQWQQMPLEELRKNRPSVGFREMPLLKEVDRGARRSHADWELTERLRQDGLALLLPDVQSMRTFANLIRLRARLELVDGDFPAAIHSLQTGYTLARHTADAPTLIQALVGMALAAVMNKQVEEMIQDPKCPNLYWALTDLPRPFIDMRKPMQGERLMFDALFPDLRDLETRTYTVAEIQAALAKSSQTMRGLAFGEGGFESGLGNKLFLAGWAVRTYSEGKKFLLSQGKTAEQVEAMPALQVALILARHQYYLHFDNMLKWMGFPYYEAEKGLAQADRALKEIAGNADASIFARLLLPAVSKVLLAEARQDRQIAALRVIEAIRMYAAGHEGQLPARLADIQEVPIPIDPITGKEFEYFREGDVARLRGVSPLGPKELHYSLNYEIKLRKKP